MTQSTSRDLQDALDARYRDAPPVDDHIRDTAPLVTMAGRGSCRKFLTTPVPEPLLDVLCATALSSPSKSDLQQRDIVVMASPEKRRQLAELVSGQDWVVEAPVLLVFCGNNRRQKLLHDWSGVPFANDHLDAFFNAAADAAIALATFVTAAESQGLGCCPISAIRNDAQAVANLLQLPDRVFPFAGLAVGYPASPPAISMRLPLAITYHKNAYTEENLERSIPAYDADRKNAQPYASQRYTEDFGTSDHYTWSEDKTRQYSRPEREDFGAFVRKAGFNLK